MNKVLVESISTVLGIRKEDVTLKMSQENTSSWDSRSPAADY